MHQNAHVPLRVVKHRRVPAPGNKVDVLQVLRQRVLQLFGCIASAVQAQQQLPDLSFLGFVVFPAEVDKDLVLLLRLEICTPYIVNHDLTFVTGVSWINGGCV